MKYGLCIAKADAWLKELGGEPGTELMCWAMATPTGLPPWAAPTVGLYQWYLATNPLASRM